MIISILGAGKSSYYAIEHLSKECQQNNWELRVYDHAPHLVSTNITDLVNVNAINLDSANSEEMIAQSNIVVSLLPANLHFNIAQLCLKHNTHFATASFVSPEMQTLHDAAKNQQLIFLNECGLDPGIDHMSTCQVIDDLKSQGATITEVESYCGGLIAKEDCSENPWEYKFAWSPRNLILAGQSGPSAFIRNKHKRIVQWHQLFKTVNQISLGSMGDFDAYPNRDSMIYRDLYHIQDVHTLIRGTLRRRGFCAAWQQMVEWGFTDNSYQLVNIKSIADFSRRLSGFDFSKNHWKENLSKDTIEKIQFLQLERETPFSISQGTAADFLIELLLPLWELKENDKDEIVLYHSVKYVLNGQVKQDISTLQYFGQSKMLTAMSALVGLSLAMAVVLMAKGTINQYGVQIPNTPNWYNPILSQLKTKGININHETKVQNL